MNTLKESYNLRDEPPAIWPQNTASSERSWWVREDFRVRHRD